MSVSAMDSKLALSGGPGSIRFQDRVATWAAWGLAVGLFSTVGWMAMQPYDPLGAVSVFSADRPWLMGLELLAVSVVVSGLATALAGRRLPDAGVFAVALGLAVANLRGATSGQLLISVAGIEPAARAPLAWKLACEGCVWFLAILAAMVASGTVTRWFSTERDDDDLVSPDETAFSEASAVLPLIDPTDKPVGRQVWVAGLTVTCVTLAGSAIIFRVLATGSPLRSVQHGQTYFAIYAAFYLSGLIAYRYWRPKTALWGCLAPPALCLLGYAYSALSSGPAGPYGQLASVPSSTFFRALPIEYVAVGTTAAMASFWSARRHWSLQSPVSTGPKPSPRRR
ncbi:MAG: hypothetical protein ACE5GE_13565 [Phycisphaerae bacterium]